MNGKQNVRLLLAGAGALTLTACGGGGGTQVAVIPPPPPAPPPAPVPPPLPSGPIGLQSAAPFKTVSADGKMTVATDAVQFSYSAADNRYTITIPGFQKGQLVTTGANGSFDGNTWTHIDSTSNDVTAGSNSAKQNLLVRLDWAASSPFKYTSIGRWFDNVATTASGDGVFAYGIPTATGDMPLTGSAAYDGNVAGITSDGGDVIGTVSLSFDFAAGTLSGEMKPEIATAWDPVPPLGTYAFRDTVYASGSTSFSGAFEVPGSTAPSSFQGSFTGPQGAELMANWSAPYLNSFTKEWGTMVGVWIAKKP